MNMFKKNGGFTLVELIVVIAILAILAAVAVPAYTGYIAKAEEAAVVQTLSTVNTAAQGLAAAEGLTVEKIEVSAYEEGEGEDAEGEITVTVTTKDLTDEDPEAVTTAITQAEIEGLCGELVDILGEDFEGATMQDGKWELLSKVPETTGE